MQSRASIYVFLLIFFCHCIQEYPTGNWKARISGIVIILVEEKTIMGKNITFLPVLVHSVKDLIDFGRRYLEKEVIRIVFGFFYTGNKFYYFLS